MNQIACRKLVFNFYGKPNILLKSNKFVRQRTLNVIPADTHSYLLRYCTLKNKAGMVIANFPVLSVSSLTINIIVIASLAF